MTQSFTAQSKLDDDFQIKISLNTTGVTFRVGKINRPIPEIEAIVCNYDDAEDLLWSALVAIKSRKNG